MAAPAALLVARVLQGISLGGAYGTSGAYLSEIASPARRGFYSSFTFVTIILGQLLATLVLLLLENLLTTAQIEAWGWRIPFLTGAALGTSGFALSRNLQETAVAKTTSAGAVRPPTRELLQCRREIRSRSA